uniref:Amine oxidase domain-containing protein n=1 Tax=Tolypothrix bouteillei VB521301 TaxID=1479485 RepID=A0A0C1RJ11_9CYAN
MAAQRPQNTLFFAGEHCSRFPAWLQGSIESSLEAVLDIVKYKQVAKSTVANTISRIPIDDINPLIDIATRFEVT